MVLTEIALRANIKHERAARLHCTSFEQQALTMLFSQAVGKMNAYTICFCVGAACTTSCLCPHSWMFTLSARRSRSDTAAKAVIKVTKSVSLRSTYRAQATV
eukprot:16782-Heterococcus_DN1.PRE.2